jgi:hypothetical protein
MHDGSVTANPPSYTFEFLEAGKNTKYYLSRVK